MKSWNIEEFVSSLSETKRLLDIGDNVVILFKESNLTIKIDGELEPKLKQFKAVIDIYERPIDVDTKTLPIELISIDEYSDSPYYLYIDSDGNIDSDKYQNISSIEIGNKIVLNILKGVVTNYLVG